MHQLAKNISERIGSRLLDFARDKTDLADADTRDAIMRSQLPEPTRTYVSLGTHCHAAELLRRMGYRKFAGPFDWLFSSLPMIAHAIEDDFTEFLDKRHLVQVPESEREDVRFGLTNHLFYREEFGISQMFNHHDVSLPEGYAYIERAVQRFRKLAASPLPATFLTLSPHAQDEDAIPRLGQRLVDLFPGSHYLLVFLHEGSDAMPSYSLRRHGCGFTVLDFTSSSGRQAVQFTGLVDDLALANLVVKYSARHP